MTTAAKDQSSDSQHRPGRRKREKSSVHPLLDENRKCSCYLKVTEADILLDAQFYHIKHVEVKETTCRQPR